MKKTLGFICAILITVFAIMPNAYAEVQKDYGNLDMNRWVYFASDNNETADLLIDITSFDYTPSNNEKLLCNLWICYYKDDNSYDLQNLTVDYFGKTTTCNSVVLYDKNGNIKTSYTDPVPMPTRIVPSSFGEVIYFVAFPPELMEKLREEAMKNQ